MNWLCNQSNEPQAFEMKDYLNYYGSILGSLISAVATILVLVWTIKFTVKNQEEERKLSVRPYLELCKSHITDLDKLSNSEKTVFVEIRKGITTCQSEIPEEIAELRKTAKNLCNSDTLDTMKMVSSDGAISAFFTHNYILQVDMHNNGAGNAIDVGYQLNDSLILFPFCVTTERRKRLILILHDDLIENGRSVLSFMLEYGDIASLARYQQKETIQFYRDANGDLSTSQLDDDFLTRPIEIPMCSKAK